MENLRYRLKDYKISYDHTLLDQRNHITPEVRQIINKLHPDVMKGRKFLIKKLGRMAEKYPKAPIFKQMLGTVHQVNDEHDKAFEANRWLMKEHPDYLFGKINYVAELINTNDFDKIPEVLGQDMELQALYPERKEFHVEEFMAFNQKAISYFLSKNDVEEAEIRLEMMAEIDEDHPNTQKAKEDFGFYFFKRGANLKEGGINDQTEVPQVDRRSDRQTTKAPSFNFPLQMQWIYEEDEFFPEGKLKKILQLDRKPLIEDLEKALNDSIVRYDYWQRQQEEDWEVLAFGMHAIFMLTELKAEKSLGVILEILKQEEEFVETWYGDLIPHLTDAAVYGLGRDQVGLLVEFLKLPNVNGYNKANVCQGMVSLVAAFPERRDEFVRAFRDVLTHLIEKADDVNHADTAGYSLILSYVVDTGFKELLPEIKQLYKTELIDDTICDDYLTVKKNIQEQDIALIAEEFVKGDIFKKYQVLQENAENFHSEMAEEAAKNHEGFNEFLSDEFEPQDGDWLDKKPFTKEKEPGRNDPCPCGSGKKYKKCCLNKD